MYPISKQLRWKPVLARLWRENDGVIAFEWIVLLTVLTIGIASGIGAIRDALSDELGDVTQSVLGIDQSYSISRPLVVSVHDEGETIASDSRFGDIYRFGHCERGTLPPPPP